MFSLTWNFIPEEYTILTVNSQPPLHVSQPCHGEGACVTQWSYQPCCAATPRWTRHSEEFWQNVVNWRNRSSILAARTPWTVWLRDWTAYSLTLLLSHQHSIPRVFLSNLFSFQSLWLVSNLPPCLSLFLPILTPSPLSFTGIFPSITCMSRLIS